MFMYETENYQVVGQRASEIAGSIEDAIREGGLGPGDRLPSVRELADSLAVSPATVGAAYRMLRQRGMVTTHGRGGTTVSLGPPLPTRGPSPVPSGARNLAAGNPDPTLLPCLGRAFEQVDSIPRLYGDEAQVPRLLELARRRFEEDGVPADALTVVAGAMDAFERILGAYLARADRVAVEDPGHANLIDLAGAMGLQIEPVRVDDHGPIPDELDRALYRGARAVAITPRAHNPTGAVLDQQRTTDLIRVLRRYPNTLVVEDDHAAGVAGAPARTLTDHGLAHWAVVRSVSKALGPDLRVAIVAGDPTTIARVEGRRLLGPGWVSSILQALVVAFWSDPDVEKLIHTAARTYTERRARLLDALTARGIAAHGRSGLNVWIPVADERAPLRRLLDAGWALSPGERFRLNSPPALRVTTTTLQPGEAERLADDLATALQPDLRIYGA